MKKQSPLSIPPRLAPNAEFRVGDRVFFDSSLTFPSSGFNQRVGTITHIRSQPHQNAIYGVVLFDGDAEPLKADCMHFPLKRVGQLPDELPDGWHPSVIREPFKLKVGDFVAGVNKRRRNYDWRGVVREAYPITGYAVVEWLEGYKIPTGKYQCAGAYLRKVSYPWKIPELVSVSQLAKYQASISRTQDLVCDSAAIVTG